MKFRNRFLGPLFHVRGSAEFQSVAKLTRAKSLGHLFQPIVGLSTGAILGYEALLRPPKGHSLGTAESLLVAASSQNYRFELDIASMELAFQSWRREIGAETMFVNVSASTLVQLSQEKQWDILTKAMNKVAMAPNLLVLEITDHKRFALEEELTRATRYLQNLGVGICLDDFESSESNIKLWSKLTPSFIKLHTRLTENVAIEPLKQRALQALVGLTQKYGSRLMAKNIETPNDLLAIRQAGVQLGQGYYLGSPDAEPVLELNQRARTTLQLDASSQVPFKSALRSTFNVGTW
jgi:EAL domain-containing protein (putative c-di-GMP-specific phosphodiesterase class I)